MAQRFPRRLDPPEASLPVSVRDDAPDHLRKYVKFLMGKFNLSYIDKKWLMSEAFELAESDFIDKRKGREDAVSDALAQCEWERIYALIEVLHDHIFGLQSLVRHEELAQQYTTMVNGYFHRYGIGFQLVDGKIEYRGDDVFEQAARSALEATEESGLEAAHRELSEALADLSKRPKPDLTGTITHSMNALESVARIATDDNSATLGKILNDNPDLFPKPLDAAVEKMWAYASQYGRHVEEGKVPTYDEAELVVHVSAAAATYLVRKSGLIDETPTQ